MTKQHEQTEVKKELSEIIRDEDIVRTAAEQAADDQNNEGFYSKDNNGSISINDSAVSHSHVQEEDWEERIDNVWSVGNVPEWANDVRDTIKRIVRHALIINTKATTERIIKLIDNRVKMDSEYSAVEVLNLLSNNINET